MKHEKIHQAIVKNLTHVDKWFTEHSRGLFFPFYSSFDIRDSGFKVAPVDANIFPAGFNNICPTDQESSVELVRNYFAQHSPEVKNVILLTEEHTQNPYYWDNVNTLRRLLTEAGLNIRLAVPRELGSPWNLTSASGAELKVFSAVRQGGEVSADGMVADLVISNNDFSESYQGWINGLKTSINPPHELGWHRRRKDSFFREYNILAKEFCDLLQIDSWLLEVETQRFAEFDVNDDGSRERLAGLVDEVLAKIKANQVARHIEAAPFVFVKNNSGTYGLGVTQVSSGDEIRSWNYKSRKKMKAAKGGRDIEEVIVQEGIPTQLVEGGATAEPAIYMIGCQLAGGFLRTHESKGPQENLNSPGAVFKRLCVSDLKISVQGHPMENVYGWVARLSFLAIAREARNNKITCQRFRHCLEA